MRLLITGASGLLGLNLSLLASAQGHHVIGLSHTQRLHGIPFELKQVDLRNKKQSQAMIEEIEPEAIIHCAAIANISEAEKDPVNTHQINAVVPEWLSGAAARWDVPFVYISSDAVFDGEEGGYRETDTPHPLSHYAQSKLEGEQVVQAANPKAIIARVVFYGWSASGKRSLSEFFYNHLLEGKSVNGFEDTFFCPLYVEDLGQALLEMIDKGCSGLYHVTSPECLSKYTFGVRIAERFGFDPDLIVPIRASEIDRGAARSLNLALNSDKVQAALGRALPSVDEGIEKLYQRWQEGLPAYLQTLAV